MVLRYRKRPEGTPSARFKGCRVSWLGPPTMSVASLGSLWPPLLHGAGRACAQVRAHRLHRRGWMCNPLHSCTGGAGQGAVQGRANLSFSIVLYLPFSAPAPTTFPIPHFHHPQTHPPIPPQTHPPTPRLRHSHRLCSRTWASALTASGAWTLGRTPSPLTSMP